jgi:hypothetical protein
MSTIQRPIKGYNNVFIITSINEYCAKILQTLIDLRQEIFTGKENSSNVQGYAHTNINEV